MPHESVELLVIGAGMAGLTAAAQGAQAGLSVLVVEKATEPGGAAALSEGYIWTTPTLEALQAEDPDVDPVLVRALADEFLPAAEWVRTLGVELGDRITGIYRFGHGYRIDIHRYLDRCREEVERRGSIMTGTTTHALRVEPSGVAGADLVGADGRSLVVSARQTVLATGGFQGSRELRAERIGPEAADMLVRALPASEGDGLRLAESVGADFVDGRHGFYGHLVPAPLDGLAAEDFVSIAVLHSGQCLLLNRSGRRFTDESLGDHANNQAVLRQPGSCAVLLADERTRREHLQTAYIPGMQSYDKFGLAAERGAHVVNAETLNRLIDEIGDWGYDVAAAWETVRDYNRLAREAPAQLVPASAHHCRPLDEPPFYALEVQPAITFPYGGIRVDASARVLGGGAPIPGLLAAGVDIGGVYTRAYAGALSRGLVFGRRAALTAAELIAEEG